MDKVDKFAKARAERDRIEAGAKALRHRAVQDHYAGLAKPDVAFAFASILDMMSMRWAEQDDAIKAEVLAVADMLAADDK